MRKSWKFHDFCEIKKHIFLENVIFVHLYLIHSENFIGFAFRAKNLAESPKNWRSLNFRNFRF